MSERSPAPGAALEVGGTPRRPQPDTSRFPVTLSGQLRAKLPYYVAGAALLLGLQAFLAQRDFLVRDAVDAAVGLRPGDVKTTALWIAIVAVSAGVVRVLSRVAVFTAGRNVEYELRALLLDRLQRLGPSFFRRVPTGDIMSRATNDLTQVRLLLGFGVLNIIGSSFALVSALYVMLSSSWKLTVASLVTLPLLAAVTRSFSSRMFVRQRENQEAIGKMSDRVLASLAGVRVVRAFGLVAAEQRRFEASNLDYLGKSLALARLRGSMAPIMGALSAVGVLITFWYGGVLLERGELSPGAFVAFWLALVRLTWPLLALGFVASIIQRGRAGYERLRTVFDAVPEITSGELRPGRPVRGGLRVDGLSFEHASRKVLDGVSFEVPPGSSVAIVGRTGSGKSTLASLLPRLLPTPRGAVFLDGDDVCDLPLDRVRGSIGYAQQDAFLFSTTVARNVGYALDDPDSAEAHRRIEAAAAEASVLGEIGRLPDGFDTVVGERGVQLSGGQRQRVALARALLRGAPVLVLDDPLSAVDAQTEAAILAAIDRQKAQRTVVLVTHRIAAARRCDRVVVLDEGKVVEEGTHDELVARGGIYAAFAREQALEAELEQLGAKDGAPPEPPPPAAPADAPGGRSKGRSDEALARFHEEGAVETYDAKHLRALWPYLRPERAKMALSLAMLIVASLVALGRPLAMRSGLDAAVDEGGLDQVIRAGIVLTCLIVVEQAIAFPQMYLMQIAGARGMANLRRAVFAFLHTRSLSFFDRQPVGRLVTRVTNDVDAIGEMFASGALNAFGDLLRLVLIVAVMMSLDWQMSLLAFAALPPVMLFVGWTRRRIRDAFREIRVKTARMNATLNEQVSGMAIVQAYAHEPQAAAEFDAINEGYRQANNRSIVYDASLDAAIETISSLCIASVLWFAGLHAHGDRIGFGTLFAFIAYIEMFFVPIRDLSSRYTLVQSAMTGAERVFELLDNQDADASRRADAPGERATPERPDSDAPAIELDRVTFGYKPGVPVLHEVSLVARRGERVALVGATGAGKSTVASLVLRLYEHQSGAVRVEGKDVLDWEPDELRARFAVVPQEVFLFPGTLASNVAAGDDEPDRERVRHALATVGALDLFERREGGIDAAVAERGANFSAGERQLIAFARALYRDPPILILDEATANVDSDTEARLSRAVERAMRGRTCLVIAHRLSTIRAADRIVVFHRGRVVEQGTHDELLARGGVYAKLHALQFAKERGSVAA